MKLIAKVPHQVAEYGAIGTAVLAGIVLGPVILVVFGPVVALGWLVKKIAPKF